MQPLPFLTHARRRLFAVRRALWRAHYPHTGLLAHGRPAAAGRWAGSGRCSTSLRPGVCTCFVMWHAAARPPLHRPRRVEQVPNKLCPAGAPRRLGAAVAHAACGGSFHCLPAAAAVCRPAQAQPARYGGWGSSRLA